MLSQFPPSCIDSGERRLPSAGLARCHCKAVLVKTNETLSCKVKTLNNVVLFLWSISLSVHYELSENRPKLWMNAWDVCEPVVLFRTIWVLGSWVGVDS